MKIKVLHRFFISKITSSIMLKFPDFRLENLCITGSPVDLEKLEDYLKRKQAFLEEFKKTNEERFKLVISGNHFITNTPGTIKSLNKIKIFFDFSGLNLVVTRKGVSYEICGTYTFSFCSTCYKILPIYKNSDVSVHYTSRDSYTPIITENEQHTSNTSITRCTNCKFSITHCE